MEKILREAIDTIKKYCKAEFGQELEESSLDIRHMPLGCTGIGPDDAYELTVEADLADYKITYFIDSHVAGTEEYTSLHDMYNSALYSLDFSSLVAHGTDLLRQACTEDAEKENAEPYKVVTLLGSSTKFKDEFRRLEKELTFKGCIAISLGFLNEEGCSVTPEQKKLMEAMMYQKIRMADEVLVVNKNGYIGKTTANEIRYAESIGKPVRYLYKGKE